MGRCAIAFITILLSPVGVLLEKGPGIDFLINLVLFVVLLDIGGIIHAFHVYGVPLCTNLLCLLLPPFGVFCSHGYSGEFCVSVLLTLFGFFPGFFVFNTIGAGLNTYIKNAENFSFLELVLTPEIYFPISMFIVLIILSLIIKNKFFKNVY